MSEKKRIKLIESFSYSIPKNKLTESVILQSDNKKLLESISNQVNTELQLDPSSPFVCYAVVKDIPVTKYTLNANNRIYSKELWQKVHQKGSAERSFSHANHSSDDGDVSKYFAVWHNFRPLEDKGVADLYVIDNELGRSFIGLLLAGGLLHFSSYGYGDMLYDEYGNETQYVDPDCYELLRLADWVAVSSQNVITNIDENAVGIQKKTESQELSLTENSEFNRLRHSYHSYIDLVMDTLDSYRLRPSEIKSDDTYNKIISKLQIDFPTTSRKEIELFVSSLKDFDLLRENKNEILEISDTNKEYNKMENKRMQDQHTTLDYWRNRTKTAIKESVEFLSVNKFEEAFRSLNDVKSNIPKDDLYKQFQEKIEDQLFLVESKKSESVKNLEGQYSALMAENQTMKQQIEDLTKVVQGAALKLKEQDETTPTEPVAPVEETASDFEAKVDEVAQAVDQLATVIDDKDTVIEALNAQVADLQTQVVEAETETQAVVSAAEEKVAELGDTVQELTAQVAVMESKLKEAQLENKKLKEEMTSADLSGTPTNPIEPDFMKPEDLKPQYGEEMGIDTITDEEDVSAYVDEVIQDDPMLRENKVHLMQSKNRKAVDRKIANLKAVKEEKEASERNILVEAAVSSYKHINVR